MSGRLKKETIRRREWLGLSGLFATGAAIFGSLLGMVQLPKARVLPEVSSVLRVGKAEEFTPGTIKVLPDYNVRVIATQQGIAAMSLICTHLGCIVQEKDNGFSCPCHGSKFDSKGNVTGGPAPRPLRWLSVAQAADGTIVVDNAKEVAAGQFYQVV